MIVLLGLTDQRSGTKFCDQYGKSFSRKELYTAMTMKNILVVMDYIYRKMDAASMFEELVFMEMVYIRGGSSIYDGECCLDHQVRSRRYLYYDGYCDSIVNVSRIK